MPRKIRPRLGPGYDWGKYKAACAFSPTQLGELIKISGLTASRKVKLRANLEAAGLALQGLRFLSDTATPVSETRAALDELSRAAHTLQTLACQIYPYTRTAIAFSYHGNPMPHEVSSAHPKVHPGLELMKRDAHHLRRFTSAIDAALLKLPRGAGRPPHSFLNAASRALGDVWRKTTGKPVQISSKRGNDAATRFLNRALEMLAPRTPCRSIEVALRHAREAK